MGVAGGSVGVAAVLIAIVLVTELPGASQGASTRRVASGGATVQYRDLVSTDTESGTLGYASPETVFNRLSGTITSLPKVGQVVAPGQTLYRVSGNPVVLFDGTVPAYRDLTSGDSDGSDIVELNRDLRNLGFDPEHLIALNDAWQTATTDAVERWQASLGETQTGTVTLGQIVFLPGAQRISTVDTALGSTGGAAGASGTGAASGSSSNASTAAPAPRAEFVGLTKPARAVTAPAVTAPAVTVAVTGTAPCSETGLGIQPGAATGATTNPTNTTATAPPTTPATTTTPTPTTTAASPPPRAGTCSGTHGSSSSPGRKAKASSPSTEAALLALLKAETLELKKSLSGSGSASRSSASAPSTTGSATGRAGATSTASAARTTTGAASASSSAGTGSSASGSGNAGTAQAILQTTSNQPVVTVGLDATKQSEAVVGERVSVQLPAGDVVSGQVTQVSSVAQSSTSSSSSGSGGGSTASSTPTATIPVTIKVLGRHRLNGLDQAAVSVNFVQQEARHVLSVPVTALLATAGGGYAVQEVAAPHRLAAVTPGLFAAGFVQISGAQVYSGLAVTDSQG